MKLGFYAAPWTQEAAEEALVLSAVVSGEQGHLLIVLKLAVL